MHPSNERPERSRKQSWWPVSWPPAALLAAVLTLGAFALDARSHDLELADAQIFFEYNLSDGDVGIQASLDGEPWSKVVIYDTTGEEVIKIFEATGTGNLGGKGLSELGFEGVEPALADADDPGPFLVLFPEGEYLFEATLVEARPGRHHDVITATVELTHDLPGETVYTPGDGVDNVCPDKFVVVIEPAVDPFVIGEVVSFAYEVTIEQEDAAFSVDLPPIEGGLPFDDWEVDLPPGIFEHGATTIIEVLAKEVSGNVTITLHEFMTAAESAC